MFRRRHHYLEGGVGERSQLAHLFELTPCYGVTLIALAADWSGGSPFPGSDEACRAGDFIRTTLRPLASPRKSGSTGAQSSGLGAHFVTFPRLLKNYTVRHGGDIGCPGCERPDRRSADSPGGPVRSRRSTGGRLSFPTKSRRRSVTDFAASGASSGQQSDA